MLSVTLWRSGAATFSTRKSGFMKGAVKGQFLQYLGPGRAESVHLYNGTTGAGMLVSGQGRGILTHAVAAGHRACHPPSIGRVAPVMSLAAGLHRNTAKAPTLS